MSLIETVRTSYLRDHPSAAARSLEELPSDELEKLSPTLPAGELTSAMELMASGSVRRVFARLPAEQKLAVLQIASSRLALLVLGGLEDEERALLIAGLPKTVADELEKLRQFPENSAGRLMEPPFETIRSDNTVAEVLDLLRTSTLRRRRSLYVVDRDNHLVGRVDMQALALADPANTLDTIMDEFIGSVSITADREEIVEQLERHRVDSVPVVDFDGHLVGVVRYQRLFEAIESVVSADLQTMVGASADERALSSATFAVKRRLPWLHINLLTAFLAAAVVGLFEDLIAQFTMLAVLLPVVAGQSGNAGSQALAVTIRGLALREIGTREWRRVLSKETWVGLIDGLALAVTCGLGVYLWSQSLGLMLVIAIAMVLSMIAAGVSGALVPIVLTRVGQDPATASSIILTTVTDVAGFFSFLGAATFLSFLL